MAPSGHGSPRRNRTRRSHAAAVSTAILLLLAQPGAQPPAQGDTQKPPPEPPTFRIEANFVRVDVYPTIDGQPVSDLKPDELELLEDGVPQTIETFEHVEVRGFAPREERREPQTVAEARAMAEDPRSRLVVLFLDTYHTQIAGSHAMRPALIDLLNRVIGPDDMFAVMTPEMSAADLAFTRRTTTIEGELTKHWYWGQRDRLADWDEQEQLYVLCFPDSHERGMVHATEKYCTLPGGQTVVQPADFYRGVAKEMIARRRERRVFDAFKDLAIHLGGVREERKAVVAISDGWALYRPNLALARLGECDRPPGGRPIGIGPDGRLTTDVERARGGRFGDTRQTCEEDRQVLAHLDNWQAFRDLFDYANRFNVSFYPIDSRGLPVFDTQIWEGVPPEVDRALLNTRIESLRTLAANTDGLAVVNSNDFTPGIRRIVADLTSYYLIGYYSTNTTFDGRLRSIRVRVKRPGVDVRARRGYRAVSEEELARAREVTAAAAAAAPPTAFQTAIASLAAVRPDTRFLTHVSWIAAPRDEGAPGAKSHVWVTGEFDASAVRDPGWAAGARAEIQLTAGDGVRVVDETRTMPPPVRSLDIDLPDVSLEPGDYSLRVRVRPAGEGLPYMDTVRFTVPDDPPSTGQPRLFRRGQVTGNRYIVTADPRFRRNEWLRVDVPMHGQPDAVTAELLDRTGSPLQVPVSAKPSTTGEGTLAWASAEVSLAPLAPGDYAVKTTVTRGAKREELITAFRIVR